MTVGVHIAIISLLLTAQSRPAPPKLSSAMTLFDVPPAPPSPKPEPVTPTPPRSIIVPPLEVPLSVPPDPVVTLLEQADLQSVGGVCDLTAPVQAALQSSAPVRDGLLRIPREGRSVANAIMLWNADWIDGDVRLDTSALAEIRDVVAETIATASSGCRLQPQGGPRLIILSGPTENTVLALGSGQWRWQDLLDTARARSDEPEAIVSAVERNSNFGDGTDASSTLK